MNAAEDLLAPDPVLAEASVDFAEMRALCREAAVELQKCAAVLDALSAAEKRK